MFSFFLLLFRFQLTFLLLLGVPYVMLVFCEAYFLALKKHVFLYSHVLRIRVNASFLFCALRGGSHGDVFPSFSCRCKGAICSFPVYASFCAQGVCFTHALMFGFWLFVFLLPCCGFSGPVLATSKIPSSIKDNILVSRCPFLLRF